MCTWSAACVEADASPLFRPPLRTRGDERRGDSGEKLFIATSSGCVIRQACKNCKCSSKTR